MENREEFLVAIARKLGRPVRHIPEAMPEPVNTLATTRLTELTSDQRCEAFIKFASEVMLAECVLVSPENAPSKALDICWKFGSGQSLSATINDWSIQGLRHCYKKKWALLCGIRRRAMKISILLKRQKLVSFSLSMG